MSRAFAATLSPEMKVVLSTIYGEAANSSMYAMRCIALVILNRVGKREWKKYTTPYEIATKTGFDAYTHKNLPYRQMHDYLTGKSSIVPPRLPTIMNWVNPVFYGESAPDITLGSQLYYSPRAQNVLHLRNPKLHAPKPRDWDFSLLEEVTIPVLEKGDDFRFYRYKR